MDHLNSTLEVDFAQLSDAGTKPENQDTVGARIPEGAALTNKGIGIAIADGVSSSQAARQASQAAITGFLSDYYATPDTWSTQHSALQVIQSLNRYLWSSSHNSVQQEGLLTTLSVLILKGDTAFTFHIGDSRIYRLRHGELEQLTRDHTQRLDRKTTYLSRALGADASLEIDAQSQEIEAGDLYLLTTDGIHQALPRKTLAALVSNFQSDLPALVKKLVESAVLHGSDDNASVQVCRVLNRGLPSQRDSVTALAKLPFPPLLEPGQKLDDLRVLAIVQESERSQVYKVAGPDGTPLILKTPSVNYEDDPAYIERFVLENWVGTRIHNHHVARVVPPPAARSFLYYLTEYVAGPTLKQLIDERAPFSAPDALEIMEQVVKGVRAFHRRDTLHQDLKPDNIIIGRRGAVIIDFGSCWVAGVEEIGQPFARDTILGTLDYSAPEYRYGGPRSAASEQFSLGVIFYEMVTGHKPYGEAYTRAMDLKALQKLRYIPATRHNPLLPVWLDRALEKAVAIHPKSRYSALSEWLTDLKRPNPQWVSPRDQPLMERNPLLFWQCLAAVGWLTAIIVGLWGR